MVKISVKIHESYKRVVAICDSELVGKNFKEGNFQLDVTEQFYGGKEMSETEVKSLFQKLERAFPSYNIVGKKAVELCLKQKLINENGIKKISGIPYAMVF